MENIRSDYRERLPSTSVDGKYNKVYKGSGGKNLQTKEGCLHTNMCSRVKSQHTGKGDLCYTGVSLSDNFKDYNYFVEWCRQQTGFHTKGWVLDKDILSKEDKIYSEDTCVFIPIVINSFLTFRRRKSKSGYAGVSWQKSYTKSGGKYIVSCAQLDGKNKTLGRTDCPKEGYQLYRKEKVRLAKVLAASYKGLVDHRVYEYLDNFEEYIDDLAIKDQNNTKGE